MISTVVLTKNEQRNLARCLESLKWCKEIVVVDDRSEDETGKIASEYEAKVFFRDLEGDFAAQRNFAIEKAKGDWILFVDADEEVSEELKMEIKKQILILDFDGFYLKRKDNFMGKWLSHGETSSVRLLRLARKDAGSFERDVDEVWVMKDGKRVGELESPLLHYSHTDLKDFLTSINSRSSLNADYSYKNGVTVSFFDWLKPLFKFFQGYLFQLGFLDGTHGFVFAVLMSLHSFLVRGKLFLLWKRRGGWSEKS